MLAARPAGRWEVDWSAGQQESGRLTGLVGRPVGRSVGRPASCEIAELAVGRSGGKPKPKLEPKPKPKRESAGASSSSKTEEWVGCGVWGVSQFAQSFMHYLFIDTFASRAIVALPFRRLDTVARQFARFGHG